MVNEPKPHQGKGKKPKEEEKDGEKPRKRMRLEEEERNPDITHDLNDLKTYGEFMIAFLASLLRQFIRQP